MKKQNKFVDLLFFSSNMNVKLYEYAIEEQEGKKKKRSN